MKQLNKITLAISFLIGSIAQAAVPGRIEIRQSDFIVVSDGSKELDLRYIHNLIEIARIELRLSPGDVIPMHLRATDDESKVGREILSHTISRFLDRTDSAISKSIRAIEAPFRGDFAVAEEDGTVHKVEMNIDAGRAIASVSYSGLVDGRVQYQIGDNRLDVELTQSLGDSTKLVFNHSMSENETTDIIGLVAQW